jgi:hypothetical protein|nr:MAG TPA: hypothetical protein [Bacteriophage sp.]
MMELRSVIVDECGTIKRYCGDYSDVENEKYLKEHSEYYMTIRESEGLE